MTSTKSVSSCASHQFYGSKNIEIIKRIHGWKDANYRIELPGQIYGFSYDIWIRLKPGSPNVYNGRAWSRYLHGQNAEALHDVNHSLSLLPTNPVVIDTKAHILAALKRPQEALTEFERAMEIGGASRVKKYQEALKEHGYDPGPVDGNYGEATQQALLACLSAGCRLLE